jgi:putative transcriptional regulator
MTDPFFQKSLIYICEHDGDGAMGVIINKTIPSQNVQDILTQTGLNKIKPYPEVYLGGPIAVDMGLILHDSSYKSEGELKITSKIKLTSNNQIIEDIINDNGPDDYLFSLGYSGWGQGQLEREIEDGDWLIMPANYKHIFKIPNKTKWSTAAIQFGIDINSFSGGKSGKA